MSFGLSGSSIPESGIGGFFDSLLGGVDRVNRARDAEAERKIEIGTAQRAAAQQQLDQMTRIMKANSAMTTDPKMIAKVKQLAQVAGLPDPISTTPAQPAQAASGQIGTSDTTDTAQAAKPAQLGKESVNMDIVAPPVVWNDLDKKTQEAILQATPGDQRNSLIGDMKVPDYVRTADPLLTGGNKTQILKNFQQTMHDFNTGVASGTATAAQIGAIVQDAASVGIHPEQLIDMVHQNAAMSPETSAKIAQAQSGVFKNLAGAEKDKAIAAYEQMLTVTKPAQIEAMIRQNQQRADATTENAQTNRMGLAIKQQNADTSAMRAQASAEAAMLNAKAHTETADAAWSRSQTAQQTLNFNEGKQALIQLNTVSSLVNKDYIAAQKAVQNAMQNGVDAGEKGPNGEPSLLDQLDTLSAKKDALLAQQLQTGQFVSTQGTNAYQNASGTQGSISTGNNNTSDNGRFQQVLQNGQAAGIMDTKTGNYIPFPGVAQDSTQTPNHPQGQQGQQQAQPPKPTVGKPPKFMPDGLVEAFKSWSPEQQRQLMQSDKLIKGLNTQETVAARQYLRTLAPQNSEDHAKQQAVSQNMGNAPKPAAPVTPTDPWATVDQVSGRAPFVRGAGTDQLEAMQNAFTKKGQQATQSNPIGGGEPDVFSQIGKGIGAASSAIGGAAKGIGDALGNKPPSNVQPGAPEQAMQAKMAQAALPVVINELKRGVPITQVLMDMQKHGIDHDTAMRILQQIHGMTQQKPQGGSEGANPKANEQSYLPPGLLGNIEKAESAGGKSEFEHSEAGAEGPFQFMPGTAKEYGVNNPYDLVQSARGATKYLAALGSEFHHDWAKAVAGYNAGGGAVEAAVRKYGEDWLNHMPKETQNYVAEVLVGSQ